MKKGLKRALVVAIIVAIPFIIMALNIPYIAMPFWWFFGQVVDGTSFLALILRLVLILFAIIAYCYIFKEKPKTPIFFFWIHR